MSNATLVSIAKSPLHGRGVFAKRDIATGTMIGMFRGKKTRRNGIHVLWHLQNGRARGLRVLNEMRFLNHSEEPNAEIVADKVYALRDIAAGEEITIHY